MINLDSAEEIKKLDSQAMLGSIEEMDLQIGQAWEESSKVVIRYKTNEIDNIVVSGMGGSALGARIIDCLYSDTLKVPLEIVGNYGLPAYINERTLLVASSYSGTTEETVESFGIGMERGAKIIAIASGKTIIELAKENGVPYYQISPDHNPSGQPRMALGYSIVGQLGLLNTIGLIDVDEKQLKEAQSIIKENNKIMGINVSASENPAKQLAQKIYQHIPLFIGSDHLSGAIQAARNQFNENGKNYADFHTIPELNHHLLECLGFPKSNKDNLIGIFIKSALYQARNQKRIDLTIDIMAKGGIQTEVIELRASSRLAQVFEVLHHLAYVNYYLALLNGIDPSPIPWVDYFKSQLAA